MKSHVHRSRKPHTRKDSRLGTVLICVLACLVVTSALIGGIVQTVLRERQELRLERQLRQTELLCEAGVMRAAHQLKTSTTYEGETWTPKLNDTAWDDASVDINVTPSTDSTSQRIEVVARLGSKMHQVDAMQRSHTFMLQASTSSTSEK